LSSTRGLDHDDLFESALGPYLDFANSSVRKPGDARLSKDLSPESKGSDLQAWHSRNKLEAQLIFAKRQPRQWASTFSVKAEVVR
jgi:hypothetical protein